MNDVGCQAMVVRRGRCLAGGATMMGDDGWATMMSMRWVMMGDGDDWAAMRRRGQAMKVRWQAPIGDGDDDEAMARDDRSMMMGR